MQDEKLAKWLEEEFDVGQKGSQPILEEALDVIDQLDIESIETTALWDTIEKSTTAKVKSKFRSLRWIATAAALALGLFAVNQVMFNTIIVQNSSNELLAHTLPDQSIIYLNVDTKLEYYKSFNKNRDLKFEGEGFFEVKKGSTFSVLTPSGSVQVLGTSFNIFARDDLFTVSCKTGKVQVSANHKSKTLLPSQRVTLSNGLLKKDTVTVSNIGQWKTGESSFEGANMQEVISSILHQYNLKLDKEYPLLSDMYFTGSYKSDDMDIALKMVLLPMNIEYSIKNNETLELSF